MSDIKIECPNCAQPISVAASPDAARLEREAEQVERGARLLLMLMVAALAGAVFVRSAWLALVSLAFVILFVGCKIVAQLLYLRAKP